MTDVIWLCLHVSTPEAKVLPGDLTHYVVPDVGVVLDYLEILEFRELQGIIFTQTVCQAVQHNKGRRYCVLKKDTYIDKLELNSWSDLY